MSLYLVIHILASSIIVFYFFDTIFMIAISVPRERIWNLLLVDTGHCFKHNAAYMATGIFNVLSDFAILILPMVPIWKLDMPLKRKIMMIAVFATGVL